ncbi:unnamed protein product [Tuber aestivum]|uniref:Uncharacterized protein n=1 Tax=Tuber aestivum TaxID=59557 RepID=A0A292Q3W0_9PEZI|nr:unnamed protein product [Tuber aestivum]
MPLSLLDLPNEMALGIADELPPGDINSLMQTHPQFAYFLAPALMKSACSAGYCNYGKKALFRAANRADHSTVKRLISYGLLDHVGRGVLVDALLYVDETGICTLLECGVEANVLNEDNMTPLCAAAITGNTPAVRLLAARDDININAKSQHLIKDTVLHLAAVGGHLDIVQFLLSRPELIRDVRDLLGWSPLHRACRNGRPEVVQCLLEDGGFTVTTPDRRGDSPLHLAAENGNEEVVIRLLQDPRTVVNQRGNWGRTPLLTAVISQNLEIIRVLLEDPRTDVNIQSDTGWTPLISAIKTKDFKLVRMLVTQGRDIDLDVKGIGTASPLHIATMYGQYDTVELLLNHGANPNVEDHRGDSPFVLAVNGGHEKIVRLFLSRGCVDLEKLDNSKMSVRLFKERYIYGIVRTLDQILGMA